jgi:hypothetical protein
MQYAKRKWVMKGVGREVWVEGKWEADCIMFG